MRKTPHKFLYLSALVVPLIFVGCASAPKNDSSVVVLPAQATPSASTAPLADLIAEATSATSAGKPDKALSILDNAAKLFPADKKPWVQMAQIEFDGTNYGNAIVNALEALQRDPKDQVANSIIAVSGLRLSTKALTELSHQNNLSGSVKTEAQDLAKLLRERLGETALVPPPQAKPVGTPAPKLSTPSRSTKVRSSRGSTVKPATTPDKDGGGSPFGALR